MVLTAHHPPGRPSARPSPRPPHIFNHVLIPEDALLAVAAVVLCDDGDAVPSHRGASHLCLVVQTCESACVCLVRACACSARVRVRVLVRVRVSVRIPNYHSGAIISAGGVLRTDVQGLRMAAINVDMPALSSTMKEGKIVQWTVKEGDKVCCCCCCCCSIRDLAWMLALNSWCRGCSSCFAGFGWRRDHGCRVGQGRHGRGG